MTLTRFARAAWISLALTVSVIAGGAVVRATGSGAGCGSDWPECRGGVVPFSGTAETFIEFTHRATSGLAFLAVVGLALWSRRAFPAGHRIRRAAMAAVILMVVEVLIGAALVTNEWVGEDASVARAAMDGLHLVNTLFLLAALTLVAWWSSGGAVPRLLPVGADTWLLFAGLAAVVVVASSGALTALGDTLFPDATVGDDFDRSSHFLVRLRTLHPILAVVSAGYLLVLARHLAARRSSIVWMAKTVTVLVIAQVAVGIVNLTLKAPLGIQVVHLIVADLVWIALVILASAALAPPVSPHPRVDAAAAPT